MMTELERIEHNTRDAILRLLSDGEVARICIVESETFLSDGDEYLDLDELAQGVRLAHRGASQPLRAIPKKAVYLSTWYQILAKLSAVRR